MLTVIQDDLLLAEVPFQASCDANSSIHHVQNVAVHRVHPQRVRSAQLTQPDASGQLHICKKSLNPLNCHTGMVQAGGLSASRWKCLPRVTDVFSRSLCRSRQKHCQVEAKQYHTRLASALACICLALAYSRLHLDNLTARLTIYFVPLANQNTLRQLCHLRHLEQNLTSDEVARPKTARIPSFHLSRMILQWKALMKG